MSAAGSVIVDLAAEAGELLHIPFESKNKLTLLRRELRAHSTWREDRLQWRHYPRLHGWCPLYHPEFSAHTHLRIFPHVCPLSQVRSTRITSQRYVLPAVHHAHHQFLLSIGDQNRFNINLEDEVVRRSIITHRGEVLWPAPAAVVIPPPSTIAPPVSRHPPVSC